MDDLKHLLRNLGIEGWIFGLIGLIAIVLGIAGFFGFWPFNTTQTMQILVEAIGALMLAVVALMSRRHAEILELKETLGISEAHLLDANTEYWQHLAFNVAKTEKFALDTFLNWAAPRLYTKSYLSGPQSEYQRLLFGRVSKGKIRFRQVQVIYHKQGLEEVIHKLLLYEGKDCEIRHYEPPPVPIPILHMTSLDDKKFYLGVGYPKGAPPDNQVLYIREPKLAQIFMNYWRVLWEDAIPLNLGGINWEELKRIGSRLGITESEFESMVSKVRDNVQSDKNRLEQR